MGAVAAARATACNWPSTLIAPTPEFIAAAIQQASLERALYSLRACCKDDSAYQDALRRALNIVADSGVDIISAVQDITREIVAR